MAEAKPKKTTTKAKRTTKPKLVKMVCGEKTADVHPDMVEDYKKGGYVEA